MSKQATQYFTYFASALIEISNNLYSKIFQLKLTNKKLQVTFSIVI